MAVWVTISYVFNNQNVLSKLIQVQFILVIWHIHMYTK